MNTEITGIGTEEGEPCNRRNDPNSNSLCQGIMVIEDVEGCTCHISPPCGACYDNPLICDTCGELV